MSRIGRKAVPVPKGVEVGIEGRRVVVKGVKGSLSLDLTGTIAAELLSDPPRVVVRRGTDQRAERALHGLYRALIANMVRGVTEGFRKELEIMGVGYRAELRGKQLAMQLGYAKEVVIDIPDGITVTVPRPQAITVEGVDKQLVGQVASLVRHAKAPDPYKQKGVKYRDEVLRKLPGKTFASVE